MTPIGRTRYWRTHFRHGTIALTGGVKAPLETVVIPLAHRGWHHACNLYQDAVDGAIHGARMVEVGAWLGMSTRDMASRIRDSGKLIQFATVDTWAGSINEPELMREVAEIQQLSGRSLYGTFLSLLLESGLEDYVQPLRMTSLEAASLFPDGSLDFVFLDGDHEYAAVVEDCLHWAPKVKEGGIIGGDDYGNASTGVQAAVDSVFGSRVQIREPLVWMVRSGGGGSLS